MNALNISPGRLSITVVVTTMMVCSFLLWPGTARAASLPLDDPWIMFCLLNEEPEDVGDCIDGLPAQTRTALRKGGLSATYEVKFEVVDPKNDTRVRSSFTCPHEFGDACVYLIDAVLALGGTCIEGRDNTTCTLP
jgi:hypothetical protein